MDPLLSTKLRPSQARPKLVARPRLTERMERGPGRRLALVSAPAYGLLGLRRWAAKSKDKPLWRLVPGIVWKFVPAALLVGLPSVVELFSGRVFSYKQLFLSMPDVVTWLSLSALLGVAIGVAHTAIVAHGGSRRVLPRNTS